MSQIVNLTPHVITFIKPDGSTLVVEPSGTLARVTAKTATVGDPVTTTVFGEVTGLPSPEEGTIFVVSSLVAQRCTDRTDVFITSESVRDDKGRIIGCRSLGRI